VTQKQIGYSFLFPAVVLAGVFPLLAQGSFSSISPIFSLGIVSLIASLFFAAVLTWKKQWKDILVREVWGYLIGVAVVVGIVFYGFMFYGLEHTSAGNGAIVMLMEIFFSFLILGLWGKETFTPLHAFGAFLMMIGAGIVIFPGTFNFQWGDMIILIGTIFPPLGNYFAQQARKKVSSSMIMFVRSFISGIFLLLLAIFIAPIPSVDDVTSVIWLLLLNGIFILGLSKIFFMEALHRLPVTIAISFTALTPVVTLFLVFIFFKEAPTLWQMMGLVPMIVGVLLIER
jgi:drug/metabolite transporter (DMT)-like permease